LAKPDLALDSEDNAMRPVDMLAGRLRRFFQDVAISNHAGSSSGLQYLANPRDLGPPLRRVRRPSVQPLDPHPASSWRRVEL
jgi:hypothetical protein